MGQKFGAWLTMFVVGLIMVLFVAFLCVCLGFRSQLSPLICFLTIVWRFMIRRVSSMRYNAHQMQTKSACNSELHQNEGWGFARVKKDLSPVVFLLTFLRRFLYCRSSLSMLWCFIYDSFLSFFVLLILLFVAINISTVVIFGYTRL